MTDRFWEWVSRLTPRLEYIPEDVLWDLEYGTGLDVAMAYAENMGVPVSDLTNATEVYDRIEVALADR